MIPSFFTFITGCAVGAITALLFAKVIKNGKLVQQKKEFKQLTEDKLKLKNQNDDLVGIINKNQNDIRELSEAVATLSYQVIQSLQLLSSITRIQQQKEIGEEIIITQKCFKKYERFLNSSDTYRSD